ncbi:MAG: hypothetical protein AAF371_04145 [Pseudomonadota bacterium]
MATKRLDTPLLPIGTQSGAAGQLRVPHPGRLILAAMEAFGRFENRRAGRRMLREMPERMRRDIGLDL